jgi:hypothetical protein
MKAVKWNAEVLIADRGNPIGDIAEWVDEAGQGERLRVEIRPSKSRWDLQRAHVLGSQALFREGCVKVAEANLRFHPQKGRVLAEIHRRFDLLSDVEFGSEGWTAKMTSIYDYAGAWSLAARMIEIGLRVRVHEGRAFELNGADDSSDVEIVVLTDKD